MDGKYCNMKNIKINIGYISNILFHTKQTNKNSSREVSYFYVVAKTGCQNPLCSLD